MCVATFAVTCQLQAVFPSLKDAVTCKVKAVTVCVKIIVPIVFHRTRRLFGEEEATFSCSQNMSKKHLKENRGKNEVKVAVIKT